MWKSKITSMLNIGTFKDKREGERTYRYSSDIGKVSKMRDLDQYKVRRNYENLLSRVTSDLPIKLLRSLKVNAPFNFGDLEI